MNLVIETTFPIIVTKRLVLRPFSLADAKEVQRLAGNPKIAATTATIPHPYLDGMAEDWISKHADWFAKGDSVNWAIEHKTEKKLVGCVSIMINKANRRAEIGYWVAEEYWNKGYCTEAAIEAIRYGFQRMNLNKITARHVKGNPASGKVMLKMGMEQEGLLKQDSFRNGNYEDMVVYGLLAKDFK